MEVRRDEYDALFDLRKKVGLEETNETRTFLLVPRSALLNHAVNKEKEHILFNFNMTCELIHDFHRVEGVLHLLQHLVPVPLAVEQQGLT